MNNFAYSTSIPVSAILSKKRHPKGCLFDLCTYEKDYHCPHARET